MQEFDEERYPEYSRITLQFERSSDYSGKAEIYRKPEQEARALILAYEQQIAGDEQAELVELIAMPEDEEADWKTTFADGHMVTFWYDNHQRLLGNRVHIVRREV